MPSGLVVILVDEAGFKHCHKEHVCSTGSMLLGLVLPSWTAAGQLLASRLLGHPSLEVIVCSSLSLAEARRNRYIRGRDGNPARPLF